MKSLREFIFFTIASWCCTVHAIDNNFKTTLTSLCDALLQTQITDKANANYGALVCLSKNPDVNKIHSRAAEAVYPFAVEYKLTGQTKYRDAAIILGDWLIAIQETTGHAGGWSEDWPDPGQTGWYGTTADQLISLAGAYAIVKAFLNTTESANWSNAISKAADYVRASFPLSNVNYNAIGGAALRTAYGAVSNPKAAWLVKADTLIIRNTLDSITSDNLLSGEGKGIDQGYDLAQSIGYVALYAILKNDPAIKKRAVDMLHAHFNFVYPNGSIDNSWGTRSFKWGYESGTKTAPGVYFSFALLADADPAFNAAGLKCLEYLRTKCIDSGWVTYGPHAKKHASSTPPCNYQTFARAQSIALAIEYGPDVTATAPFPAQTQNWYKYFSGIKVAVVRTQRIMGTVSAYGNILTYSRNTVPKGGSICNLWYEGFGDNGYLQSSSATIYTRTEDMHMPVEDSPLPLSLTPRVECTIGGTYYTNLFETSGTMTVTQASDNVSVTTAGHLVSQTGTNSAVSFTIVNRFYSTLVRKEITVSGAATSFSIVEPFVKDPQTAFVKTGQNSVTITPASQSTWTMRVDSSTVPYTLSLGTDSARYWCPFPGVEGYPVIIGFTTPSTAARTIALTINGPPATPALSGGRSLNNSYRDRLVVRYSSNAMNHRAEIRWFTSRKGTVTVRIFSLAGRLETTLYNGNAGNGEHVVFWDNPSLPNGVYICALSGGGRDIASVIMR
jgi:hypothetical protein